VRYFNGILFVFTLVFLKCAHYSTDFGTRMGKKQNKQEATNCLFVAQNICSVILVQHCLLLQPIMM